MYSFTTKELYDNAFLLLLVFEYMNFFFGGGFFQTTFSVPQKRIKKALKISLLTSRRINYLRYSFVLLQFQKLMICHTNWFLSFGLHDNQFTRRDVQQFSTQLSSHSFNVPMNLLLSLLILNWVLAFNQNSRMLFWEH